MNIIDQISHAFQIAFDDKNLSRNERKALKKMLKEANLDQRKKDILRSRIFDIAEKGMGNYESRFVLEWAEDASRLLEASGSDDDDSGSSVYFSPGEECRDAIITLIRSARRSLDICVFTISDDEISKAILDRHKMGTPIRLISDNDKCHDAGSDIFRLNDAGIHVRLDDTDHHMHHKFAVVDREVLLTGSYNWTRSAAKYNEENILVTRERGVVAEFQKEFDRLWKKEMVDLS